MTCYGCQNSTSWIVLFLGSKPLSREKGISEDDRGEDAINEEMNYIGLKGVGSLLFTC